MKNFISKMALLACTALILPACAVAKTTGKIAAMPVKAVYKTTELAGKTVYHTGRLTGKGVYKTTELAGKSVYHTGRIAGTGIYETGKFAGKSTIAVGKGVYYVGSVPVKIADGALDTTARILTITTQAVDLTGKVVTVARDIQAIELDAELKLLKHSKDILGVLIERKV